MTLPEEQLATKLSTQERPKGDCKTCPWSRKETEKLKKIQIRTIKIT